MAEGHGRQQWATASLLAAVIANCHRDPKKGKPLKPTDFNPYEQNHSDHIIHVEQAGMGALKREFTGD